MYLHYTNREGYEAKAVFKNKNELRISVYEDEDNGPDEDHIDLEKLFDEKGIYYADSLIDLIKALFEDNHQKWRQIRNLEDKLSDNEEKREYFNLKTKQERIIASLQGIIEAEKPRE